MQRRPTDQQWLTWLLRLVRAQVCTVNQVVSRPYFRLHSPIWFSVKRYCIAVNGSIPWYSYGVSLAMWHHTVLPATRHKWTPPLTPAMQIYLPRRDGRLSWPSWLDSAPTGSRTCDLSITSPTLSQCNYQDTKLVELDLMITRSRLSLYGYFFFFLVRHHDDDEFGDISCLHAVLSLQHDRHL